MGDSLEGASAPVVEAIHWNELVYLRDWLRERTPDSDPGLLALDWVIASHGPSLPTADEAEAFRLVVRSGLDLRTGIDGIFERGWPE